MATNLRQFQLSSSPPLESGDRLSRAEFERRYQAALGIKKAELIEGVVYLASPLRFGPHAEPHSRLVTCLGTYAALTPYVLSGIEPTIRLDLDNEPQPDAVLLLETIAGGKSYLSEDGYLEGVPELVAEIAASSAAIDTGDKKAAYCRNGIQEYIVWQIYENQLEWFQWIEGAYQPLLPDQDGIVRSQVFPGLWLAVDDLLNQNMARVLAVLQAGLQTVEHQRWVQEREALVRGANQ